MDSDVSNTAIVFEAPPEGWPDDILRSKSARIPLAVPKRDASEISARERAELLEPRGEIRIPPTWDVAIRRGQPLDWLYVLLFKAGKGGLIAVARMYFLADARRTMQRWWRAWSYGRWLLSRRDTPEAIDVKNHQCAHCRKLQRTDDGLHCSVCECAVKPGTDVRVKNSKRYGHCQLGIHAGSKRRPWQLSHCASGGCGKRITSRRT